MAGVNGGDDSMLESRECVEYGRDEHIARQAAGKIEVQMQRSPFLGFGRRLRQPRGG
jgi:hypothetical protein